MTWMIARETAASEEPVVKAPPPPKVAPRLISAAARFALPPRKGADVSAGVRSLQPPSKSAPAHARIERQRGALFMGVWVLLAALRGSKAEARSLWALAPCAAC